MKASANSRDDDLRPEYDLSRLKGCVRGKYYQQAVAATNLVSIKPDLAAVLGDAVASTGPARRRHGAPDKRVQPARQRTRRAPDAAASKPEKLTPVGKGVIEGLKDAIAHAREETTLPGDCSPGRVDSKAIRAKSGLSQ
jgi:hypothetical protein